METGHGLHGKWVYLLTNRSKFHYTEGDEGCAKMHTCYHFTWHACEPVS